MKGNTIPKFFDFPTQVAFRDEVCDVWIGGIAYYNEVICMECGSTIELEDIYALVILPWVDISDEVLGDVMES